MLDVDAGWSGERAKLVAQWSAWQHREAMRGYSTHCLPVPLPPLPAILVRPSERRMTKKRKSAREMRRELRLRLRDSISIICRFVDFELCDYAPPCPAAGAAGAPRPPDEPPRRGFRTTVPQPPPSPATTPPPRPRPRALNRVSDYLLEIDFTCSNRAVFVRAVYAGIVLPVHLHFATLLWKPDPHRSRGLAVHDLGRQPTPPTNPSPYPSIHRGAPRTTRACRYAP